MATSVGGAASGEDVVKRSLACKLAPVCECPWCVVVLVVVPVVGRRRYKDDVLRRCTTTLDFAAA